MSLSNWFHGETAKVCLGCGWYSYDYRDPHDDCDERFGPREVERVKPNLLMSVPREYYDPPEGGAK